jgi:tripartite ATP-independent transporter DctM subunit
VLLTILIAALLVLVVLGMEIAWAMGVACLAYLVLADFADRDIPFLLFPQQVVEGMDSYSLMAIALFVFSGELMSEAGITQRLVRMATAFVGHIRGGLANVAVVSNLIMADTSGSAIADAAATGTVLIPQMKAKGYPVDYSCAVVAAASTVGPLFPPSISFVLLGAIVNVSAGKLFLGGIVPGVIMALTMLALTWVIAGRRNFPVEPVASWRERIAAFFGGLLPLAAPAIVVVSMVKGIATPSEAASILVFYILFLGGVLYRRLTLRRVVHCAANAMLVASIIMLTVGMAQMFAWLSLYEQFGQILTASMLSISHDRDVLLLMLNLILLVLGTFMEPLPLMLILGPIVFPLFGAMGVDPVQLGVVMVFNLILGLITPLVGLILNVVALIGRTDVMRVFWEVIPYKIVLIIVLFVVTYVPIISLWLPRLLMPD